MGLTAHCSMIGFFFSFFFYFLDPFPSGLSSIAILLPFLINLLFTTSTTFPIYWGTEYPGGHSSSHFLPPVKILHSASSLVFDNTSQWLQSCQMTTFIPLLPFYHSRRLEKYKWCSSFSQKRRFLLPSFTRESATEPCNAWFTLVHLQWVSVVLTQKGVH